MIDEKKIKVSIITVTYNSDRTLEDTINSVDAQNYPYIEYIIVDGGSTDRTVSIIQEASQRMPIKWISEPDKGLYDAINKGIDMATGDVVGIINSDDFYHRTDAIQQIARGFKNSSVDCVFADVRFVDPSDLKKTIRYYSSKGFLPAKFRWGYMPAHPTFFAKREHFRTFGNYKTSYKISADFELLLRFLLIHKLSYAYLPVDLLKMRTGGVSTNSIRSNYILNKEIVRACRENGIYTNVFLLSLKYFTKVFEYVFTKN